MGCPLKNDKGVADFKAHPKLLRAWVRAGIKWWNRPREKPISSLAKFGSIYGLLYSNLFCHSYEDYYNATHSMFSEHANRNFKTELENYFGIGLP